MDLPKNFENLDLSNKWLKLINLRNKCNISIEEKRASKVIGSSLEAKLEINLNEKYKDLIHDIDFSELCITSKAKVIFDEKVDIEIKTIKASGNKCPVCWKISDEPCIRHS